MFGTEDAVFIRCTLCPHETQSSPFIPCFLDAWALLRCVHSWSNLCVVSERVPRNRRIGKDNSSLSLMLILCKCLEL